MAHDLRRTLYHHIQRLSLAEPDGAHSGDSRAQVDALKLLAVFVQHSDSKPDQQALICAPGSVKRDHAGNETCASPWLMVKDLGTTFGKATALNTSKMNLADWSGARVWREGGRKFLARRLLLLRDQQIRDLFKAPMADRRGGTIDEWVRVFKRKRHEIVQARCPAG